MSDIQLEPNRLYDFDIRELNVMYMSLASLEQMINESPNVPAGLATTLHTATVKLQDVIELRVSDYNNFQDIVDTSLTDLLEQEQSIVKEETENK